MLAAYLTGALVCITALVAGRAARLLFGFGSVALVPGVGLAIVLIVANLCEKLPGGATAAGIGVLVLLLASVVFVGLRDSKRTGEPNPDARTAHALVPISMLLAVFAVSIPFLVNGRMGPLGAGLVNDDMASHLLFTDWLITHAGAVPDQVGGGYPLGPHSLVAGISRLTGAEPVEVFAGLTFAIAALTAATAFAALENVRPLFRVPAAALTAVPYLGAAWLAQGAFKEPMLALLLLAFALGLRQFEPGAAAGPPPGDERGIRRGESPPGGGPAAAVSLGLLAAGTLYLYSFPGWAWLAGAAIAWGALELFWRRREGTGINLGARVRAAAPTTAVVVGIAALAALPELGRMIDFTSYNAFDPEDVGTRVGFGNLVHPLTPLEGFNVWPSSEFRVSASSASIPAPLLYIGALIGIAALAWGLLAALQRRESALPAALISGATAYVAAAAFGTPYTSAKALAIVAPIAMLIALRGLLTAEPTAAGKEGGPPVTGGAGFAAAGPGSPKATAGLTVAMPSPLQRLAMPLAVLFVVGAAVSSFLPLRAGAVGPNAHADQIKSFRDEINGRRVLFLGREQYVAEELIGSKVATPILNYYNQKSIGNRFPPVAGQTVKLDFDSVTPELLDFYAFAITTTAGYRSEAPPNFAPVGRTHDYILWKRTGPTPPRRTLDEPDGPGAVLDCATPQGRALAGSGGTASVFAATPVVGAADGWRPSARVTDSRPASQELALGPGRWAISLQYVATQDARLTAPGLDAALPANLDFRGPSPFWPAGEIEVGSKGPVRFTLSVDRPPPFGRLIGADSLAFPLAIAATRVAPEQRLPVRGACDRYVDFIEPPQ